MRNLNKWYILYYSFHRPRCSYFRDPKRTYAKLAKIIFLILIQKAGRWLSRTWNPVELVLFYLGNAVEAAKVSIDQVSSQTCFPALFKVCMHKNTFLCFLFLPLPVKCAPFYQTLCLQRAYLRGFLP